MAVFVILFLLAKRSMAFHFGNGSCQAFGVVQTW